MKKFFAWGSLLLLAPLGCTTTEPQIRPPKPPEEFIAPPPDAAFSKPVAYPAESMDQDPLLKKAKANALPGLMKGNTPGSGFGAGKGGF